MVKKETENMSNKLVCKLKKYFTIDGYSIYNQNVRDAKAIIVLAEGEK